MRRRIYDELGTARIGAVRQKVFMARALRHDATRAERLLWDALRRKALGGLRFRRQHPVAGFIVDFYCPALKLALEVDGAVHEPRRARDIRRDRALRRLGVVVLRVQNDEVVRERSRMLRLAALLKASRPAQDGT